MSTTLQSIIEEFSQADQALIQKKANILAMEMIEHAESLAEIRNAFSKTQEEVAQILNVKQNAVAQLEKRSDLLMSTLRKYVEAMGGELAVAIRTGTGTVIMLDGFSSLSKATEPVFSRTCIKNRKQSTLSAPNKKVNMIRTRKAASTTA